MLKSIIRMRHTFLILILILATIGPTNIEMDAAAYGDKESAALAGTEKDDIWIRVAISQNPNHEPSFEHDRVTVVCGSDTMLDSLGTAQAAEYKSDSPLPESVQPDTNHQYSGPMQFKIPAGAKLLISSGIGGVEVMEQSSKPNGEALQRILGTFPSGVVISSIDEHATLGIASIRRPKSSPFPIYRGKLEVKPSTRPGKLLVINLIRLEDYLRGVVPNEMPTDFPIEALKAQAIASRSYTVVGLKKHSSIGADLCDGTHCHVYYGAASENRRTDEAIAATRGLFVLYRQEVASACYSSTAGGFTENNENVWPDPSNGNFPGNPIPYLRGVPDDSTIKYLDKEETFREFLLSRAGRYDSASPYFRWKEEWSRTELESILASTLPKYATRKSSSLLPLPSWSFTNPGQPDMPSQPEPQPQPESESQLGNQSQIQPQAAPMAQQAPAAQQNLPAGDPLGQLLDIRVLKRGISGKIISCEIKGSRGTWVVEGELKIRSVFKPALGSSSMLKSANVIFDLKRDSNGELIRVTALGAGFGHGVGMSQWGARGMAAYGESFRSILGHYYQGTAIGTMPIVLTLSSPSGASSSQIFSWPGGDARLVISRVPHPSKGIFRSVVDFLLKLTSGDPFKIKSLTISFNNKESLKVDLTSLNETPLAIDVSAYLRPGLNKAVFEVTGDQPPARGGSSSPQDADAIRISIQSSPSEALQSE